MKTRSQSYELGRLLLRVLFVLGCTLGARQVRAEPLIPSRIRVCLVGDSTMAEYQGTVPNRGWGQYLQGYFKNEVLVVNRAEGGRSSKSFQTEGLWKKVLAERPDYVLIQFACNDAHAAGLPESTAADGEYPVCLERYVKSARKAGIEPIFITPVHPRTFTSEGKLTDTLEPYAAAMRSVSDRLQVPLLDLHVQSGQLLERLGKDRSEQLAATPGDLFHFNELGARALTELVVRELRERAPRLAHFLQDPGALISVSAARR